MRIGASYENTIFTFVTLIAIMALIFLVFRIIPEFGATAVVPVDCSGFPDRNTDPNNMPVHSKTIAQCLFPGFLIELDWSPGSFAKQQPVYSPLSSEATLISATGTIILEYAAGTKRIYLSPVTGVCDTIVEQLKDNAERLSKNYLPESLPPITIPAGSIIGIIPRETGINHLQVSAFEFAAEETRELVDGKPVTKIGDNKWVKRNPAAALGMTNSDGEIDKTRYTVKDKYCSKKDFENIN